MFDTISHFLIASNWLKKKIKKKQWIFFSFHTQKIKALEFGKYPSPAVTQFDRQIVEWIDGFNENDYKKKINAKSTLLNNNDD